MARRASYSKAFEPRVDVGDLCLLLGATGWTAEGDTPFWECTGVEPAPLLGVHGVVVPWAQGGVPGQAYAGANPYIVDAAGSGATIQPGGSSPAIKLNALTLVNHQLLQFRSLVKVIGTVTGAIDDYDVIWAYGATQRWKLPNVDGVQNAMQQAQQPSDVIAMPAQGVNMTLPAVQSYQDPFEQAWRTEMYAFEQTPPTVSIRNNGAAATAGTFAIGLQISGFLFSLRPLSVNDFETGGTTDRVKVGLPVKVPHGVNLDDVTIIQLAPRQPA